MEMLHFPYLQNSFPWKVDTCRGKKRTVKFCLAPGFMVPTLGSMLKGGSSEFNIRSENKFARGRASVSDPADLLPGREVEVPSVKHHM